jgi:hypothetical protein
MPATQQSQAIQNANLIISLAVQALSLVNAIDLANAAWNDDGSLANINALATCALNTDGSLGAADGTVNNTHPIDTRVAANSGLSRAISASNIASCLTQLNAIAGFVAGSQAGPTAGVRSLFNQATGG